MYAGARLLGRITGPRGGLTAAFVYHDQLTGLNLSATGANTTVSITAGNAVSDEAVFESRTPMSLGAFSKTTAAWAVGTGNGGLDTGAVANNTWYHVFEIQRPDTGLTDALLSLSATAPTMPANYTKKRRIGSVRTDATPNIIGFTQDGDFFQWLASVLDVDVATPGTAAVTRTLTVPTGVKVIARVNFTVISGGGASQTHFSDLSVNDEAPSLTAAPLADMASDLTAGATVNTSHGPIHVLTNTSAQIRTRGVANFSNFRIATLGWFDRRGKG